MNNYKKQIWARLLAWLTGAAVCGVIDHIRQSSVFLPIYFPVFAVITLIATRTPYSRRYKFELVAPGVVRSRLGFEVRVSNSRLEYIEGNHVISWLPATPNASVGRFNFSEQGILGWDQPFGTEPMDARKKQEVARAVMSALLFLQLPYKKAR